MDVTPNLPTSSEGQAELEQLRWVQALAFRLCSDHALAEDLAQEVALAGADVLERPASRASRAWLAGILRRKLAMARRSKARRLQHEQSAAEEQRPSTGDDPQDLLLRFETHRQVSECVASLREPYRTTLLQRYFEGRSPREIARAAGLPLKTVKTRLTRAHQLLREELEARLGPANQEGQEPSGWYAALLPLAHQAQLAPAPMSSGESWSESLLQAPVARWCLGVAVLVATGSLALVLLDETEVASPTSFVIERHEGTSPVNTQQGMVETPPLSDPQRREDLLQPGESQNAKASRVDLEVRAVDPFGNALPGNQVVLQSADGEQLLGLTDAAGELVVQVPLAPARLGLQSSGLVTAIHGAVAAVGASQSTLIVAAPPRTTEGLVLDPQGRPVEGVDVVYRSGSDLRLLQELPLADADQPRWKAITDSNGQFVFEEIPDLPQPRLLVRHGAYESLLHELGPKTSSFEILQLTGFPPLRGRVVDRAGLGVADAWVSGGSTSVQADAEGRFAFSAVEPETRELRAVHPGLGFGTWNGSDTTDQEIEIVLTTAVARVNGTVRNSQGRPVVGARVGLANPTGMGILPATEGAPSSWVYRSVESFLLANSQAGRSDEQGRFSLPVLADCPYQIFAADPETLTFSLSPTVRVTSDSAELALELDLPHREAEDTSLTGRVTDAQGRPLASINVQLAVRIEPTIANQGAPRSRFPAPVLHGSAALSREDGSFVFPSAPSTRPLLLTVFAGPGYESVTQTLHGERPVQLVLHEISSFHLQAELPEQVQADSFALKARGTEEVLHLYQHQGVSSFSVLRGEIEHGRSPVYRARLGECDLYLYRGQEVLERRAVRITSRSSNTIFF